MNILDIATVTSPMRDGNHNDNPLSNFNSMGSLLYPDNKNFEGGFNDNTSTNMSNLINSSGIINENPSSLPFMQALEQTRVNRAINKRKGTVKETYNSPFGKMSDDFYATFKDELDEMSRKIKYNYAPTNKRSINPNGVNSGMNIKDITTTTRSEKSMSGNSSIVDIMSPNQRELTNDIADGSYLDNIRSDYAFNTKKVYYQRNTKNKSFIKTAQQLELLGIKNNDFCLTLFDPLLMDVDPCDPNLSLEMQARVTLECTINFWYFIREVVKINEAGSEIGPGKGIPYALHRGNLALNYCLINNYNTYLVLPRQNYKTMSACVFYLWVYNLATTNSEILLFNKDMSASKDNLRRIYDLRECLPEYLQFINVIGDDGKIKRGNNNATFASNPRTNNNLTTKPSATSVDKANNLGRGCTAPMQWTDEFEWQTHNECIYKAASPAFSQAKLSAKSHNKPYHKLVTTTPGNLKSDCGIYGRKFNLKCARFLDRMYDWDSETQQKYLKTFSKNDFFFIYYSYKELGRDEAWFDEQCRGLDDDPIAIRREILCEWIDVAENPLFDEETMVTIRRYGMDPIKKIRVTEFCELDLYDVIDLTKIYLIGVDVAAGVSRDASTTVIIDPSTCKVVASFNSNVIDPTTLSEFLEVLCVKYFKKSVLCIENNYAGCAVISNLKRTGARKNLYFQKLNDQTRMVGDAQGFFQDKSGNTFQYGITTKGQSRADMMEILLMTAKKFPDRFVSNTIIGELAGLRFDLKKDRIDHSHNSHDDTIMAYLISMYVYMHGANLIKFGLLNYHLRFDDNGRDMEDDVKEKSYMDLLFEVYGLTPEDTIVYDGDMDLDSREFLTIEEFNSINRIKHDQARNSLDATNTLSRTMKGLTIKPIIMEDDPFNEDPDVEIIQKHGLIETDQEHALNAFLETMHSVYDAEDDDGVFHI